MVSIPSPIGNYLMLWAISLGSSIGLMLVAAVIYLLTGKTEGVTSLFILMFNATATTFILLTMIPAGLFILLFSIIWNAGAPILAPILGAIWNFFAGLVIGMINIMPLVDIPFRPLTFVTTMPSTFVQISNRGTIYIEIANIDVAEAIGAVTSFLDALRQFLIGAATGGESGTGVFGVILHKTGLWS